MDSENDIYKMCRLCLAKERVDIHIFEQDSEEKQIFLKISTCLPIKVGYNFSSCYDFLLVLGSNVKFGDVKSPNHFFDK